ncbi:unnamed protein product [Trichogramma brassicae]|uniref:Integrase catalytic domain-containing protein n=1 Tax=Trichogramma brassicae TaxID=86971 RepID=A0A6H5IMG0_9HYME|nr:unnamed protein product [Trichogramma brassicae]
MNNTIIRVLRDQFAPPAPVSQEEVHCIDSFINCIDYENMCIVNIGRTQELIGGEIIFTQRHADQPYNIQIYTRNLIGLRARVCTCVSRNTVRDLNSNGARAGSDSSPRTSAPTTDELATTEDANNTTEVVETGLSEDDLLKAAVEIDISQRIIERRAYEAEDIIDEKDLELTTVVERNCLSDGTAVDEETREYLDSIDPYDEVRNNDRTLSETVEKLIRETQTKVSQEQNDSTASVETEATSPRKEETPILAGSNRPTDRRGTPDTPVPIPIPNLKASTIADALARHLICQFGAPRAILSDRGTSFLSDLVESVLWIFKVKHLTTSSYRPLTNGSLERSHGPLVDFIRTYSENYDDWDRLTPFATFTYHTSVHSATNFTPFEMASICTIINFLNDGRSHRRYKHPAHKQQPRIILRGLRISGTEKGNLASRHLLKYYGVDQGTSTAPILYTIGTPLLLENSTPSCDLFKTADILQQFRIIQQLQEKIKVACQTTIPPNTLRNPLSVKLRRSAPLAIIGTLSKSLFGTATEDEINIIQTSLKSLSQEQSDLIKLYKEKTHLLMQSMDTVANVTQRHEELLVELDGILRSETTEIEHLQYEVTLLAHFSTIAKGIENRIRSLEQIEIILRELRSGRIPPQLLTQSIAQEIAIDIQQNNPDLEIPIPREHLRPEEILKISTADMIYIDGHTTAIIYIPLTERTRYKLYKLHPLEIPQFSRNNTPIGTAFIRPAHPYLLLSATHKQYIMYDNENLRKCLQGHSSYVCPIQSPVKEVYLSNECEINLVTNPANTDLKYCQIMVTPNLNTQWHYLSHDGSWLYSTTEAETIELICPDKREESAKMTGIGILKIQPGCHARTRDHLLETEEVRRSKHNYVYDTDTHLNITHLFPQIETSWHLITSMSTNSNLATKWKEEAIKIETLLQQIDAVDTQAREKRSTMSLVTGGVGTQFIITIEIIIFVSYFQKNKPVLKRKWKRASKGENPITKNPNIRNPITENTIETNSDDLEMSALPRPDFPV